MFYSKGCPISKGSNVTRFFHSFFDVILTFFLCFFKFILVNTSERKNMKKGRTIFKPRKPDCILQVGSLFLMNDLGFNL